MSVVEEPKKLEKPLCTSCGLKLFLYEYKAGICDECVVEQINKDLRSVENVDGH